MEYVEDPQFSYGAVPKKRGYPQIIHLNGIFHYKPFLGTPIDGTPIWLHREPWASKPLGAGEVLPPMAIFTWLSNRHRGYAHIYTGW